MRFMKKIKVGVKLISAFLAVAIIAGVIGLVGVLNLSTIEKNDTLLYEENTLGVIFSGDASVYYQRARFNAMKMTVTEGEEQAKSIDNVKKYIEIADANMADYKAGIISETDQKLYSNTEALWTEYKSHLNKAVSLVEENQSGLALQYLLTQTAETATALQDSYQELFNYNKQTAEERSIENYATSSSSMILLIALLSVGIIISIALGLIMTRSITKPVNTTASQLDKMARGEDIDTINEDKFSGEFRQMIQSLNSVRTSLYLLLEDSGMLVESAEKGKLSTRADVSRHQGGYRKIIDGFNSTLDAVIAPINEAAQVLSRVSEGNLNVSVTSEFAGDYAIIKNTLNSTIETLKGYIGEISAVLGEMSNGKLDVGITSEYKGDFIELKQSINSIIDSLNKVMGEINTAADQVAAGTQQVSDGSQEISQGAAEQAASIEELTASITQIAAQTKQNAMNANKANELSEAARTGAAQGNEQMKSMQQAMAEINEASESISKIIKVIDDIAFQTNILALNAAVEAARAGVHGKGFAVVAEEVRNLAARSANAAKETTELIEGSIKKTTAGTKIANDTANALSSIVEGVEKAGQLVGEIAVASNEQATGIAQINNGIEQMSQVVQTNSATAEEAAAASEELSSQAAMLKNMVAQFDLKDQESKVIDRKNLQLKSAPDIQSSKPINHKLLMSDEDFGKY